MNPNKLFARWSDDRMIEKLGSKGSEEIRQSAGFRSRASSCVTETRREGFTRVKKKEEKERERERERRERSQNRAAAGGRRSRF